MSERYNRNLGREVLYRPSLDLSSPVARYQGFNPGEKVIPAGTRTNDGARPVTCDIVFQRDVAVTLRDGTAIYTDVFRPSGVEKVPAIVAWSPYGKNLGNNHLDDYPFRMGVPNRYVSDLNKWEGPDPALWCAKGYAVVNVDTRGAYTSEGDGRFWSSDEGQDGADFIDWVGIQSWCTGKVGLSGNSWLAASQWFIAAERPKHLAAIAPWEGIVDVYRNAMCAGGIPDVGLVDWLLRINAGHGKVEDVVAMLEREPLFNDYWETHAARVEEIEVPAYVVSSWSNMLHTPGTIQAYQRLKGPKWLRIHATQEWPDYYTPQNQEDLARFFDRYLKGIDNGWEATPKARVSVFSAGPDNATISHRAEAEFPLPRTVYRKHYLDAASGALVAAQPVRAASVAYPAARGSAVFTYTFTRDVEWVGFTELVLHVAAKAAKDLDIFARVQFEHKDGRPFYRFNLPVELPEVAQHMQALEAVRGTPLAGMLVYEGPWGRLRASRREVDERRSTPGQPFMTFATSQPLAEGEIIQVRIGLLPTGLSFKAGDTLKLTISSDNPIPWPLDGFLPMDTVNGPGDHVIHTGGPYESYLLVPETHGGPR